MSEQLIADLKATKAVLLHRGRCKGSLMAEDGRVCLIGAIGMATVDEFAWEIQINEASAWNLVELGERSAAVIQALRPHIEQRRSEELYPSERLYTFNDSSKVVDQDVINVIDKALADRGGL